MPQATLRSPWPNTTAMTCRPAGPSQWALLHFGVKCNHSAQPHVLLEQRCPRCDEPTSHPKHVHVDTATRAGFRCQPCLLKSPGGPQLGAFSDLGACHLQTGKLPKSCKRFGRMQAPCQRTGRQTIWRWGVPHTLQELACTTAGLLWQWCRGHQSAASAAWRASTSTAAASATGSAGAPPGAAVVKHMYAVH